MTLQLTVDAIDTVPEPLRDFYEERDGKFSLKVEGLPQGEDTSGLKKALEAERKAAADARKAAKQFEGLGMSADEIKQIVAERQAEADKKAQAEGNFEALRKQDRERFQKDLTEREARIAALEKTTRSAVVGNQLLSALTKMGATEEGLDLLPDRLSSRVKFEFQGDEYRHSILLPDGETPMAGSGAENMATFDDLVKEAMSKWPSLFKGSGAGGGGKPPNSNAGGTGKSSINAKDLEAMSPQEKAHFFARNPGIKVVT
jgi:DNA-binding transcriptional MerR regulator